MRRRLGQDRSQWGRAAPEHRLTRLRAPGRYLPGLVERPGKRQRIPRSKSREHHQRYGWLDVCRAGGQYRFPFLISPRAIGVWRVFLAANVLDAGRRVRRDVAALRSPAEDSREAGLNIVSELAALV